MIEDTVGTQRGPTGGMTKTISHNSSCDRRGEEGGVGPCGFCSLFTWAPILCGCHSLIFPWETEAQLGHRQALDMA